MGKSILFLLYYGFLILSYSEAVSESENVKNVGSDFFVPSDDYKIDDRIHSNFFKNEDKAKHDQSSINFDQMAMKLQIKRLDDCVKRLISMYEVIGNRIHSRLNNYKVAKNVPNGDRLELNLGLSIVELLEFGSYLNKVSNFEKFSSTSNQNSMNHSFCTEINRIERKILLLIERTSIEGRLSWLKFFRNSLHSEYLSLVIEKFNDRKFWLRSIFPGVYLSVQIILLIYYIQVNIKNCLALLIANIVIGGSYARYYLLNLENYEKNMLEYDPGPLEFIIEYAIDIFTLSMDKIFDSFEPIMEKLFNKTFNTWNPLKLSGNIIFYSAFVYAFFYLILPSFWNFFTLTTNRLSVSNHHQEQQSSNTSSQSESTRSVKNTYYITNNFFDDPSKKKLLLSANSNSIQYNEDEDEDENDAYLSAAE